MMCKRKSAPYLALSPLRNELSPAQAVVARRPTRKFQRGALAGSLLLLACANAAFALQQDRQQPMDLKAARWTGSMQSGVQVWSGKVAITQGSLKINADKATLHYKDGAVERAELLGSPATVAQSLDTGGTVSAQATTVVYHLTQNKVTLSGGVKIEENGNITQGERFEYALDTGALEGDGGAGQVSLRLLPKAKKSKRRNSGHAQPKPSRRQTRACDVLDQANLRH
ncbi:MAG: lipopolysaccharide transport periplasmic protein LptA [Sphingomonadales bacterium]|nr:lipopolysaccharide transport periplasmic protein LptA [Sphingomonadales bacterium]